MRIGIYSAELHRFPEYADRGVTHIGPYFGEDPVPPGVLDSCAEQGLLFAYRPSSANTPWEHATAADRTAILNDVTDAQIILHALNAIDYAKTNSVIDEIVCPIDELRQFRGSEKRFLDVYRATVEEAGYTFWMYQPGNRTASTLILMPTDPLVMGCYGVNKPDRLAQLPHQFSQIVQAAEQLESVPVANLQLNKDYIDQPYGWISLEIWRALAQGIKGFQVWSGVETRDALTTFPEQIDYFLEEFSSLNMLGLADIFVHGERIDALVKDYQADELSVIRSGQEWLNPGLAHAHFEHNGREYLLLVNSSDNVATVELTTTESFTNMLGPEVFSLVGDIAVAPHDYMLLQVDVAAAPAPNRYAPEDLPILGSTIEVTEGGFIQVGILQAVDTHYFVVDGAVHHYNVDLLRAATYSPMGG